MANASTRATSTMQYGESSSLSAGTKPAGHRAPVAASWRRCSEKHGLRPDNRKTTSPLPAETLQQRQHRLAEGFTIARAEMNGLARRLSGTGYATAIADAHGVILHYMGDPSFNSVAVSAGLRPGFDWSESCQGTNAIGTCAATAETVAVQGDEHFLAVHRWLSGLAVPFLDADGELQIVLTLLTTAESAPCIQPHTRILLEQVAQMVENRAFKAWFRNRLVLRFHSRPESVDTFDEGLIAVDGDNRLLAISPTARRLLGEIACREAAGNDLGELLNLRIENLPGTGDEPAPVFDSRDGRRFFLRATPRWHRDERSPLAEDRSQRTMPQGTASRSNDGLDILEFGDPNVADNVRRARRLAGQNIPILIYGETGTGKELFAKSLHQASSRKDGPFVAVNCASIPESLIESELFGYKPGAFTGASRKGNQGKILQADGGTLFLDEIGDMPLALQARLLRALQEREVMPLGGDQAIPVDICLISATHRDLRELIEEQRFREDLYYRLQGFTLTLPPLRQRRDRRALIRHLVKCNSLPGQNLEITPDAMKVLDEYHWPGNIRQLLTCIRTMVALQEGGVIDYDDLPAELRLDHLARRHPGPEGPEEESESHPATPATVLDQAERDVLLLTLQNHGWRVAEAASSLAISRSTLYRKMKRHGIAPPNG